MVHMVKHFYHFTDQGQGLDVLYLIRRFLGSHDYSPECKASRKMAIDFSVNVYILNCIKLYWNLEHWVYRNCLGDQSIFCAFVGACSEDVEKPEPNHVWVTMAFTRHNNGYGPKCTTSTRFAELVALLNL